MTARKVPVNSPLTPREREALLFLAKGLTNPEIAQVMGISDYTVNDMVRTLFRRLDVDSRAEAAVRACEMGLHGTPAVVREELPDETIERILIEVGHEPGKHIDADVLRRYSNALTAQVRRALKP